MAYLTIFLLGQNLKASPNSFPTGDKIQQARISLLNDIKLESSDLQSIVNLDDSHFTTVSEFSWSDILNRFLNGAWARFYLENTNNVSQDYAVFQLFPGTEFDLYYKGPDGRVARGSPLKHSSLNPAAFEIPLAPGKTMIMVRLKTTYHFHDKFLFSRTVQATTYYHYQALSLMLFSGLLAGLFFYNFFIFLKVRTKFYGYYLCYLGSVALILFPFFAGIFADYTEDRGFVSSYVYFFVLSLEFVGVFSIFFASSLLNIKRYSPRLYRFSLVAAASSPMALLLKATYPLSLPYYHFVPEGLWLITNLMFIYNGLRRRYRPAYFFTLSWMPILLSGIFIIFPMLQDIAVYNQTSLVVLLLAVSLELILFSFTIADRAFFDKEQAAKNERDLDATNTIQNALLPSIVDEGEDPISDKPFSIFTYYRATEFSGGDWYGFQYHEETSQLNVQICDISGHGVSSSIITGVIAGSILSMDKRQREDALPHEDYLKAQADTIGAIIDKTVARVEKSATMGFSVIDLKQKKASVLLAGHPPMVLIRDGKAEFIQNRNCLFGLSENTEYRVQTFDIKSNDRLILYTDGLMEHPKKGNLSFRFIKKYFEHAEFTEKTIENDLLRIDKHEQRGIVDDACIMVIDIKDLESFQPKRKTRLENLKIPI